MLTHTNKGLALVEVVVGLVVLSLAMLGFAALQVKAFAVTEQSDSRIKAGHISQDLFERMRANPSAISEYVTQLRRDTYKVKTSLTPSQTVKSIATADVNQIKQVATTYGMQVGINACAGVQYGRSCIYVSWDKTSPTIGSSSTDCTRTDGTYQPNSSCLVLEAF